MTTHELPGAVCPGIARGTDRPPLEVTPEIVRQSIHRFVATFRLLAQRGEHAGGIHGAELAGSIEVEKGLGLKKRNINFVRYQQEVDDKVIKPAAARVAAAAAVTALAAAVRPDAVP